jgi:transcriptional regulator with XRE-family HTH domain
MVDSPLKRLRKERGFTQVELSERANVPQPYVSALELGKVTAPSWPIVRRLSRALRCKPDVLFPVPQ